MSGGSGGMPAASNKGQQMQNPQMGQNQPQGMMPMYPGMAPQGGMPQSTAQAYQGLFGGMPMQTAQQMPTQMAQQMPPQAFDQFRQEEMMMGGMKPPMGIAALGGQMPMGGPMDYGTPRFPPQGMPQTQPPYQPYMGGPDIKPTNMGKPEGMLPAGGMPPGFRPTSIDGRRLRDMMDITKRRFMGNMGGMRGRDEGDQDRLPGAIGNDLPPALRRPTQGGYKNFK